MIRILLILLGLLTTAGSARADVLQDLGTTYQKAAEALAATFPKWEGQVAAVVPDGVLVKGPGVESLRPGLEVTVFRRGDTFRHPITNQPLGHAEQVLGTVVLAGVGPEAASGRFLPVSGRPAPKAGDGARITAGRLPVAVLPTSGVQAAFDTQDQTRLLLVARFSALLEKTGRFLAVEPLRVLDLVARGQASDASPLEVSRQLGGVAVLTSRLVREGEARVLETTWLSGLTGDELASFRIRLVPTAHPPRFAWEETPELERRYPLDGPVRGLALGDLDGDGKAELVIADDQIVTAYRAPEGGGPAPVEGTAFRAGGLILAVDVAPLTGARTAQLVVVDQRAEGRVGLRARVLEWSADGFRAVYETTGRHLRVIRVGAENWLLEQDASENEPFEPEVRRLVWDGARFQDGARIRVPRGMTVYGLALIRLTGNPEPDVVAFTDDYRLGVWTAKGQRLWTSVEPLGGSAVTFEFQSTGAARRQGGDDTNIGRVAGRVVPLPGGAAGPEILVYENLLPTFQQGRGLLPRLAATLYNRGRIHRLRWRDGAFVRVWQSSITEGYIADFAYGDMDTDGLPEVVVGVVPRGFDADTLSPLGRPRGRILVYELP